MTIDFLPQLAVGSHKAGSGNACIMNAISYLNGDKTISDMPGCVYPLLARMAQAFNDTLCTHMPRELRTEADVIAGVDIEPPLQLLCGTCSHQVWMLGARLIGTSEPVAGWGWRQEAELMIHLATYAYDLVPKEYRQAAAVNIVQAGQNLSCGPGNSVYQMAALERIRTFCAGTIAAALVCQSRDIFDKLTIVNSPKQVTANAHAIVDEFERITNSKTAHVWTQQDAEKVIKEANIKVAA